MSVSSASNATRPGSDRKSPHDPFATGPGSDRKYPLDPFATRRGDYTDHRFEWTHSLYYAHGHALLGANWFSLINKKTIKIPVPSFPRGARRIRLTSGGRTDWSMPNGIGVRFMPETAVNYGVGSFNNEHSYHLLGFSASLAQDEGAYCLLNPNVPITEILIDCLDGFTNVKEFTEGAGFMFLFEIETEIHISQC